MEAATSDQGQKDPPLRQAATTVIVICICLTHLYMFAPNFYFHK